MGTCRWDARAIVTVSDTYGLGLEVGLMKILGPWLVAALVLVGCSADPTNSVQYMELASELDQMGSQLADAQDAASELEADLAAEASARQDAETKLRAMTTERDNAVEQIQELRLQYDEQIRAELRAAFDAEVTRACQEASEDPRRSIASVTNFDPDWDYLNESSDSLDEEVRICAEPARADAVLSHDEAAAALTGVLDTGVGWLRDWRDWEDIEDLIPEMVSDVVEGAIFDDPSAPWVRDLREIGDWDCGFGSCREYQVGDLLELLHAFGVPGAPEVMNDGSREVGDGTDEARPGTWTAYSVSNCYWERLDADGEIIDNNFVNSSPQVRVTIRSSDFAFNSEDCAPWLRF